MPDVMKTLLLNPPSFENFDGGASSRWPATREIESYWYPVWLTYPAGMIPGSRLLDASPHKVNWQQTIQICKDYEFLILFTSTVGLESDVKLIRKSSMRSRLPRTSTSATCRSNATTCRSCCTPMCPSTPRADARRSAPSACGRKRFQDMPGGRARRKTWRGK